MARHPVSAALLGGLLLAVLLVGRGAQARPSACLSRPKRVSDQRLAELETLIGLSKMKGKLVRVPVGFGKVDPIKIGRRRRSYTESNLQELRRLLRSAAAGDEGELGRRRGFYPRGGFPEEDRQPSGRREYGY